MSRHELRFGGFGGQGVITMAHVFGHAASIYSNLKATMTEAYGPEKTGGFSRADLVLAKDTIGYPNVVEPDVFVAFSQDAFQRDVESVKDNGLVFIERSLVTSTAILEHRDAVDFELISIPAVEEADKLEHRVVANIVMLGATVEATEIVPAADVRAAIRDIVPAGTESINERAFDRGRSAFESVTSKSGVVK